VLGLLIICVFIWIPKTSHLEKRRRRLVACRKDLTKLIESSLAAPLFLRLAWSDAATFDQTVDIWPQCGGVNGSIRSDGELSHAANAGLQRAIVLLQGIKKEHSKVSWADIIQMAGALSVELTGGPVVSMIYGRIDASEIDPTFQQQVGQGLFAILIMRGLSKIVF
jgi:L-ascorbate peroxidase